MTGVLTNVAMMGVGGVLTPGCCGRAHQVGAAVQPIPPPRLQRQVRQLGARLSMLLGAVTLAFWLLVTVVVVADVLGTGGGSGSGGPSSTEFEIVNG